jgi:hypothetical protein
MFIDRPNQRPTSLVRLDGDRLALRIQSDSGERMATRLRPMTIADAFRQPTFRRPPR